MVVKLGKSDVHLSYREQRIIFLNYNDVILKKAIMKDTQIDMVNRHFGVTK